MRKWEANPAEERVFLQNADREERTDILEGLEKGLRPRERSACTKTIAAEIRAILRKRKAQKRTRDFIRFFYGNRLAAELNLPALLKDPHIYSQHPEPDVGAAIMVVHRFAPQIAAELFNYSEWSAKPAPLICHDAEQCPCRRQTLPGVPLINGHVVSTDVSLLASPYLRDVLAKGKKYRLQQPLASVLPRLRDGLDEHINHKMKAKKGDTKSSTTLQKWASAVTAAAKVRLSKAAKEVRPEPEGYPGLKAQLKAAKSALIFGPEDRAPHAVFYACGKYYAAQLHSRLQDSGAFIVETKTVAEVLENIQGFNKSLGTKHQDRVPYLYGAWKAKKQSFRWIAGTSAKQ